MPSLAGTAVGECVGGVPWISFSVALVDPDAQATSPTATLVMTDGTNTIESPLGTLVDNRLEGRVIWPGASVDAAGNGTGWPGWSFENGQWVETEGNFRWTRGAVRASIRVNPELVVPLAYPAATPGCANPSGDPATAALPGILSATGLGVSMLPWAIAGGGVIVLGGALLLARRRRERV